MRRELLWRWAFGIPATAMVCRFAARTLTGIDSSAIQMGDPVLAAQQLNAIAAGLLPQVMHFALWFGPLLAIAWIILSGLGRNLVLRYFDPTLRSAPIDLMWLQALRLAASAAAAAALYGALHWAAKTTLEVESPNLVLYSAAVICLFLGMFVCWAVISWIFSIAPVFAMLDGKGVWAALSRSLRLGRMTGKLVEVNFVLGIVRLALAVLAMVFSAIPLPFEADMTGFALYAWWAAVTLVYFIANDFFQVVRLAAFVEFCRRLAAQSAQV